MADTFDPYLHWLGIRDPKRPPNHYRLLGVALFESDPDVLLNAADRQMAHVRTFQSGKHSADSQKLLNELAAAKLCLLDAEKRAAYDAQLRPQLSEQKESSPPPPPSAQPFSDSSGPIVSPELLDEVTAEMAGQVFAPLDSSPKLLRPILYVGGGVLLVLAVIHVLTIPKLPEKLASPPSKHAPKPVPEEIPEPPPKLPEVPPTKVEQVVSTPREEPAAPEKEPAPAETAGPVRHEVPSKAAQSTALQEIHELFKDHYANAKDREQRQALAKMLMQQAVDTHDDPTARFVLYTESCDVAAQAGDPLMLAAIFTMVSHEYELEEDAMAEETLVKAVKKPRDKTANQTLGRFTLDKARSALGQAQFERVRRLADAAREMARKANDTSTAKQAATLIKDVEQRERLQAAFGDVDRQLITDPENSEANLAAAGYYCLVKDDWACGLPLVLKCKDTAIREAAAADIAQAPSSPSEMVAIADRWYDALKDTNDNGRLLARARAIYWYQQAQPKTTGLTRTKIERRLSELSE